MEIESRGIPLTSQNDLVQLRNLVRRMMQQLEAPIKDQSRVSWMVDYMGRQVLMFSRGTPVQLSAINERGCMGLKVICQGAWLRPLGYFYSRHLLIPHLAKSDTVQYMDGINPKLTIISWINDDIQPKDDK
jgi:hypothetical protein